MRKYLTLSVLVVATVLSTASATMVRQEWHTGVDGSRQAIVDFLEDLVSPVPPVDLEEIQDTTSFAGTMDNYVAKFYGWVTVPETGTYQYHYSCDDFGMLYVSPDEDMENAEEVAWVDGWTGIAEWDKYPTQHSAAMELKKGQVMAVMAFFQEAGGGDNMDIGWTGPGLSSDIANPTFLTDYITHIAPTPTKARRPAPVIGATDVQRDSDLAWTAGVFAATHTVYLSTNFDDVNDGAASALVGDGFTEASLEADRLAFGETYYWRVDEVNGAPDYAVYQGKIWSFEVEPYSLPLSGVTAAGDSSPGLSVLENILNGSGLTGDLHGTMAGDMWISAGLPATVDFDLGAAYKLHELWIWNSNQTIEAFLGFGAKDVVVETSLDGASWTVLEGVGPLAQAPGTDGYAHGDTIDFGGVAAQHVRLTINSIHGFAPSASLSEVRFYYVPTTATGPDPADGAIDVLPTTALAWARGGRDADHHDVSIGTDADALASADGMDLQLSETYSWRVDAVNDVMDPSTWMGPVWTFTTADSIVVDDMEGYKDEEFLEIWAAWVDGFADPANGSTVGIGDTGSPETGIVNGGSQSLPFHYDNSAAAQSEATLTFGAMNWAGNGITTLVINVRGNLSNTGGDLYCKINGTKVAYDGGVMTPIWQSWQIDLSALGINLGSVTSLSIGVEGAGSGLLQVDDIALYGNAPATGGASVGGDASLVAHLKLDETEGLMAADSSGYGNAGTLIAMNGTEWTPAAHDGGGITFDGAGQYVEIADNSSLHMFDSVTIAAWVQMGAGTEANYMGIGGKLKTAPYKGFSLVRHASGVFRLWANSADYQLAGFDASSDVSYTDTEWHHVAGVVDDGTSYVYVDGVQQAKTGVVDLEDSETVVHIGRQYDVDNGRNWTGSIDDVRIYYRALSAAEIAAL